MAKEEIERFFRESLSSEPRFNITKSGASHFCMLSIPTKSGPVCGMGFSKVSEDDAKDICCQDAIKKLTKSGLYTPPAVKTEPTSDSKETESSKDDKSQESETSETRSSPAVAQPSESPSGVAIKSENSSTEISPISTEASPDPAAVKTPSTTQGQSPIYVPGSTSTSTQNIPFQPSVPQPYQPVVHIPQFAPIITEQPIDMNQEEISTIESILDHLKTTRTKTKEEVEMSSGPLADWYSMYEYKPDAKKMAQDASESQNVTILNLTERRKALEAFQDRLMTKPEFKKLHENRKKLPAYHSRPEILTTIKENQVVVISGETGCGKSTQIPQFILEDCMEKTMKNPTAIIDKFCSIICTQPRRISAVSLAQRVAQERGEEPGQSVGYHVRLESCPPTLPDRAVFCTVGVLLRKLQSDSSLTDVTHIIVDEIHERDINTDFLLIILKDILPRRPDLRVILMSATLDAPKFSRFFGGCPMISIPGFTHPVKELYLEDLVPLIGAIPTNDAPRSSKRARMSFGPDGDADDINYAAIESLIAQIIARPPTPVGLSAGGLAILPSPLGGGATHVLQQITYQMAPTGQIIPVLTPAGGPPTLPPDPDRDPFSVQTTENSAILVFLPGWEEIKTLHERLLNNPMFGRASGKTLIYPLHSSMSTIDQQAIFQRPPLGVRKIVIATNIAETSITVEDCVFVIDAGRAKEKAYDALSKMSTLMTSWVSRAAARQRAGRAGRCQPGVCFHMYTKAKAESLAAHSVPEMLRVPLEGLCLQVKALNFGAISAFLGKALDYPSQVLIDNALANLRDLNALDEDERLTPLGYHLASLPVDPRLGKIMIYGALFKCLDPVLVVAAAMSFRDPFVLTMGKNDTKESKQRFSGYTLSDHIAVAAAYYGWLPYKIKSAYAEEREYCMRATLSAITLKKIQDMKTQFARLLRDIGFINFDPESAMPYTTADDCPDLDCENYPSKVMHPDRFWETGPDANSNAHNLELVKCIIASGLCPNVAFAPSGGRRTELLRTSGGMSLLHPSSVLHGKNPFTQELMANPLYVDWSWLVYGEKVKTQVDRSPFLRECTVVSPWSLLIFSSKIDFRVADYCIVVDRWVVFRCTQKIVELVQQIRAEMDMILSKKIDNPNINLSEVSRAVIAIGIKLMTGARLRDIEVFLELHRQKDRERMAAQYSGFLKGQPGGGVPPPALPPQSHDYHGGHISPPPPPQWGDHHQHQHQYGGYGASSFQPYPEPAGHMMQYPHPTPSYGYHQGGYVSQQPTAAPSGYYQPPPPPPPQDYSSPYGMPQQHYQMQSYMGGGGVGGYQYHQSGGVSPPPPPPPPPPPSYPPPPPPPM